jgi:3-oxoacyl-[acyl-carrier protein] reductase
MMAAAVSTQTASLSKHLQAARTLGNMRGASKAARLFKSAAVTRASSTAAQSVSASLQLESGVCVVTGSSRGIGKACALALGAQGCKVAVNYAGSKEKAEEVAHEITQLGGEAIVVGANMGKVGP